MKLSLLLLKSSLTVFFLLLFISQTSDAKPTSLRSSENENNCEKENEHQSTECTNQNPRLILVVVDSQTKKIITAKVKILDMLNKRSIFGKEVNDTIKLNLVPNGSYRIISKADSHLFNEIEFNLAKEKLGSDVKITLELDPIKLGMKLELKEVYFETNSSKILEESMTELNEVFELLWEHPNLVVQIAAHTDNSGSHDDNMELSGRRAQTVVEVLKDKGVPESMLQAKGFGETKPLVPNTSEENKRKNRRVEFIVVGIN
jgi:OmpA-OmpF porin, OOP family